MFEHIRPDLREDLRRYPQKTGYPPAQSWHRTPVPPVYPFGPYRIVLAGMPPARRGADETRQTAAQHDIQTPYCPSHLGQADTRAAVEMARGREATHMNVLPAHTWVWLLASVLAAAASLVVALYTTRGDRGDGADE